MQDRANSVRPPRVRLKYEVFKPDGTLEERELPFVVGVLGDFSGNPTTPLRPLKERRFVSIDRDNFNEVMQRMTPGLQFRVENTLAGDGSEMGVSLKFERIEDFEPGRVVEQVEPLRKLVDMRNRLRDLQAMVDGSDRMESGLENLLGDEAAMRQALGGGAAESDG
jgi:type VI secretion system protein ImpB